MPWKTPTAMFLRRELVSLTAHPEANVAELARRYDVSRKTAYKWINRYREGGPVALVDRSRKPAHSPSRTLPEIEAAVLRVRQAHPAWGGRKIRRVLLNEGLRAPSPATVTAILRRHGLLGPQPEPRDYIRFEAEAPNELWQMDFKGDFLLGDGNRCFPLDALDDHSRFLLCLDSQLDQRREPVQTSLTALFRQYGLPRRLLCDNGPPWGSGWRSVGGDGRTWPRYTRLAAWLMRLGITVVHGRPYHPQTQGKLERIHRSLKAEVLAPAGGGISFADRAACQRAFDSWRDVYNQERPHDALGLDVPVSRYVASKRTFPSSEPIASYDEGVLVRKVDAKGHISFRNNLYKVGRGFTGEYVALIPSESTGIWTVYYAHQPVWAIDLHKTSTSADL